MRRRARAVLIPVCLALAGCGGFQLGSPDSTLPPETDASASPGARATRPASPRPSATPVPVDLSALQPGSIAAVITTEPLLLRSTPGLGAESEALPVPLMPHMRIGLVEGPVEADGHRWFRIAVGELGGWVAAASPDGVPWLAAVQNGRVAFAEEVDGQPQLLSVAPDGSSVQQLTQFAPRDPLLPSPPPPPPPTPTCGYGIFDLAWSPAGDALAFSAGCGDRIIFSLPDGTLTRIGPGVDPRWSPSGEQLLYGLNSPAACRPSCPETADAFEIRATDATASDAEVVIPSEPSFAAAAPDWSPDGTRLAFSGWDRTALDELGNPLWNVYIANADGSDRRQLAPGSSPRWSPDGQRLAYLDPGGTLVLIRHDGSDAKPIGPASRAWWSPDGTRIVLATSGPPDSPGVTLIVDLADTGAAPIQLAGRFANWSPDGRELLLIVPRAEGGLTLQRAPATGGAGEAMVGTDTVSLTDAAWQPVIVVPTAADR